MSGTVAPRVILHAFSTFQLGGPQARFVQLANAFGGRYRHVIAAMDNCFQASERLGPDVRWERLELPVDRGSALANRGRFRAELQRLRPDLLLSYNWGAIEWAAANWPRVVPQVHVEDGFGPEEASTQLPRRVWTRRVLLGWAGIPVVVASRRLQATALNVWRLPASRVHYVANGVALGADRAQFGALHPDASICIGTVAGLRPEKNIARLIRAFAKARAIFSVRLVIVGDGPQRQALEQLTADLGVSADVEFAGHLDDPRGKLLEFDLFALSSDTEQLPLALLEAMASGVPAISTRVGDVADILGRVAAEALCDPEDDAFAACLIRALGARDRWGAWRADGAKLVRDHYSLQNMMEQWETIWSGGLPKHY